MSVEYALKCNNCGLSVCGSIWFSNEDIWFGFPEDRWDTKCPKCGSKNILGAIPKKEIDSKAKTTWVIEKGVSNGLATKNK